MIVMQAPAANQYFGVMPSGASYISDEVGLIAIINNSTADQTALIALGCITLAPVASGTPNAIGTQVDAVCTTALPACTYASMGAGGVGDTLTANANGALGNQDGVAMAVGKSILNRREANLANAGIWQVTNAGAAGAKWVLTRRADLDTPAKLAYAMVTASNAGATYAGRRFLLPYIAALVTVGTTPLTFIAAD